jgi:hypothetical protein
MQAEINVNRCYRGKSDGKVQFIKTQTHVHRGDILGLQPLQRHCEGEEVQSSLIVDTSRGPGSRRAGRSTGCESIRGGGRRGGGRRGGRRRPGRRGAAAVPTIQDAARGPVVERGATLWAGQALARGALPAEGAGPAKLASITSFIPRRRPCDTVLARARTEAIRESTAATREALAAVTSRVVSRVAFMALGPAEVAVKARETARALHRPPIGRKRAWGA